MTPIHRIGQDQHSDQENGSLTVSDLIGAAVQDIKIAAAVRRVAENKHGGATK